MLIQSVNWYNVMGTGHIVAVSVTNIIICYLTIYFHKMWYNFPEKIGFCGKTLRLVRSMAAWFTVAPKQK